MAISKVELLDDTGVTPGSYTNANITVNADGRLALASSGGGGGSVFPDGVPAMSLGGITSQAVTQVYYVGVPGSTVSFTTPGLGPVADSSFPGNPGWYANTGTGLGRNWWVTTQSDPTPILRNAAVVVGHTLLATYDSGWNPIGSTNPAPALVFENVQTTAPASVSFSNIGSIYGLTVNNNTSSMTFTADSDLTTWALGYVYFFCDFTFTAPSLEDITTSVFSIRQTGLTVNFSGTNLNSASVDKVLIDNASYITTPFGWTGTLNLGGTCSAPSSAGLAAKASLQSAGLTVITN
jgi:hypothetical protein